MSQLLPRGRALFRRAQRLLRHDEFTPDRSRFYDELWREAAHATGAELVDLTEGFAELRNGERYVRVYGPFVSLDDPVTLELAGHKSVASALLQAAGVPTPAQVANDGPGLAPALQLLMSKDQVVVKPQSRTGAGAGVITHVTDRDQLRRAVAEAASYGGGGVSIEEQVQGDAHRLLYLDGELLDVVVRRPACIAGDGRRTVRALVRSENERRRGLGDRSTGSVPLGLELVTTLAAQGRSPRDVLGRGEVLTVSGRSNTGDAEASRSVLSSVGDDVRSVGARAAAALGVRLAGVDIITTDISQPLEATGGVVTEVNTTPGLHWHYLVAKHSPKVPVAEIIIARLLGIPMDRPAAEPARQE